MKATYSYLVGLFGTITCLHTKHGHKKCELHDLTVRFVMTEKIRTINKVL